MFAFTKFGNKFSISGFWCNQLRTKQREHILPSELIFTNALAVPTTCIKSNVSFFLSEELASDSSHDT